MILTLRQVVQFSRGDILNADKRSLWRSHAPAHLEGWRIGQSLRFDRSHHYDAIDVLKPSRMTQSGHRLYTEADVARLQQILSLRQLGFSLEQIRDCLDRDDFSPVEVLDLHLTRLREQLQLQRNLCDRLQAIVECFRSQRWVSAEQFLETIEVMTKMENLYTPQQLAEFQKAREAVGPENSVSEVSGKFDGDRPNTPRCAALHTGLRQLAVLKHSGSPL